MKNMKRDGEYITDTSHLTGDTITLYLDGVFGGGKISIFAQAGQIRSRVADGGAFDDSLQDDFDAPIRRIVIGGRADELIVILKGAVNPDIAFEVR